MQLSQNFNLAELTRSDTAKRTGGEMLLQQNSPGKPIVDALRLHAITICQPARDFLGVPIAINSGYRGPLLNTAINGAESSQHCKGEATDQELSTSFDRTQGHNARQIIDALIYRITGHYVANPSPNFYLFAYYVLFGPSIGVDQLIHEYGEDGAPDWVHVSNAKLGVKPRGQILIKRRGEGYKVLSMHEALMLGT